MTRSVSAKDAAETFSDLLDSVARSNETIVVEKRGMPVAVMISPDLYEQYREALRERFFQAVDQIRADNAPTDPDEMYEDVTAVVEQVRQERYGREQRP